MTRRGKRKAHKIAGVNAEKSSRVLSALGVEDLGFGSDGIPPGFPIESYFDSLRKSVWLMACSYRLAYAIASVGFKVLKRRDKTEAKGAKANQLRDLLDRVNPEDTYFDWIESKMVHLSIAGESFTEVATNKLREPAELWEWNPDMVKPLSETRGGRARVRAYRFFSGGQHIDVPRESVVHTKVYNPLHRDRGFSFVSAMQTDLSADIQAALWNRAFLKNGARTGGWMKPTEGDLDDGQWRRLKAEVQRTTSGSSNAGKYGVLPAGIDITETGVSPKDLDWSSLRRWTREVAAGGTGIPPILVGNFDAASYANTEQQLSAFWDYVGKPWLRKIFSALNERLVHPLISEDLILWPDMLEIDSLVDSETTRVQNTSTLMQAGVMTINEGRQRQGLPALPDGDRLLIPLALDPVLGDDLEREEPPAPAPAPEGEGADPEPPDDDGKHAKASRADREVMREAQARELARAEKKLQRAASTFLATFKAGFVARAKAAGELPDPEFIAGPIEAESRQAFELLAPAFVEAVSDSAETTLGRLGFEKGVEVYRRKVDAPERLPELIDIIGSFDELNPRVIAYLERVFGHLEDLTRETIAGVRDTITTGLQGGKGINQIVIDLEGLAAFSAERAERIARTETAAAMNLGASEAFRVAGTDRKSWLSAKIPGRTRDSHAEADARYSRAPIPVSDKFILEDPTRTPSRAELMFPSDPEAPAWAVVNCLCSMVPEQPEARRYWVAQCRKELDLCLS